MGAYLVATWRARWRALFVLALMVALSAGGTFAAVAGARRSATAIERFHEAGRTLDLFISADAVDAEPPALLELLDGPLVEQTNDLAFLFVDIDRIGVVFAPTSRRGLDIERGVLLEGRRADPDEPLELVLSERGARSLGLGVGDTLETISYSREDAAGLFERGEVPEVPGGPTVEFEVVGIVRNGFDLSGGEEGSALTITTPAFWERYGDEIGVGSRSHMVRLVDRPGAIEQFTDAVTVAYGDEHLPSINVGQGEDNAADAIAIITVALLAVGLTVATAGGVWIAAAVSRQQRLAAADQQVLRAFGATQGGRRLVVAGIVAPGLVLGLVLAPLLAVALSPLLPVGMSRHVDPRSGIHADLVVLLGGTIAACLAAAVVSAVGAARLVSPTVNDDAGSIRTSRVLATGARVLRPPAATGLRFALLPSARVAAPVRSALVGALVGVIGLVAVAVVGASLDRLVAAPARWGTTWDVAVSAQVFAGEQLPEEVNTALRPDREALRAIDGAEAVGELLYDEQVTVNGVEAISMALDPVKGDVEPTIIEGRAPRGDREIALARDTLDDAGASIGAVVEVESRAQEHAELTVVGVAAFPVIGEPGPVATGAVLAMAGAERLRLGDPELSDDVGARYAVIRWKPGVDHEAALARLGVSAAGSAIDVVAAGPTAPPEVEGLRDVRALPLLVAAGLAGLGVIATTHALVVTVARRRVELGVLSALGFTPRQRRSALVVQATTIATVVLLLGVPLGIALGRQIWATIAGSVGVATDPVVPFGWLSVGALALVLVLNLIAAWPAHAARRLAVAEALRSE